MTERHILFTPDNIRRIVAKEKWQTRRVVTPQPVYEGVKSYGDSWTWSKGKDWFSGVTTEQLIGKFGLCHPSRSVYGQVGDRLYIKEGIVINASIPQLVGYRLDGCKVTEHWEKHLTAMFMPKWAARYWLEITEIRVERVQDISAQDAMAEGISKTDYWKPKEVDGRPFEEKWWDDYEFWTRYPQVAYRGLWDSINKKKHPWSQNPFVWVISFRKL